MNITALLALIGTALCGLVRMIRTERIQALLPEQWRWDNLPLGWKLGLIFGLSVGGAVATALGAGTPVLEAISAGFVTGAAAMGIDRGTAKMGSALTAAAVAKNPHYVPSPWRERASIALPVDRRLLNGQATGSSTKEP